MTSLPQSIPSKGAQSMLAFGSLGGFNASFTSANYEAEGLRRRTSNFQEEFDETSSRYNEATPLIQTTDSEPADDIVSVEMSIEHRKPSFESMSLKEKLMKGIVYGLINAIILVPVLISFAQIIFRHPYYAPSMPYLIKLVIFSSAIHQLGFSVFSSLPFAIGQVQDAGLIFLSSMASSIANDLIAKKASHDEIMATTLCWLALSTMMLGLALIITGKLKLASLVQFLPVPVVGGYLAFIGLYCLEAGFTLMSGLQIEGILDWGKLGNVDSIVLILPGIILGIFIMLMTHFFKHFAVLPALLMIIPILFHLSLLMGHISLDDARHAYGNGWLAPPSNATEFWLSWEHYKFQNVHWDVVPKLLPTWFSMFFVVAFSSSLDVAAIQMELGRNLNFNHELVTVGLCNVMSGAVSGFTGSYIFSQTIFTMRSGIHSRSVGVVVMVLTLVVFFIPISILAFIPRFFFGAVMTFIAFDLIIGWLWSSRKLVRWIEYLVVWITFIAINFTSLVVGMLIGIGCSILIFMIQYSSMPVISIINRTSNKMRSFDQRKHLVSESKRLIVFRLNGYIFFGSALGVVKEINDEIESNLEELPSGTRIFVVIDMFDVLGIDATAVRTCFVTLRQTMVQHNGVMVLCNVDDRVLRLLHGHGAVSERGDPNGPVYIHSDFDKAVAWCEDQIIHAEHSHTLEKHSFGSISDILYEYLQDDRAYDDIWQDVVLQITPYFKLQTLEKDEILFDLGGESDSLYFIASGQIQLTRQPQSYLTKPKLSLLSRISRLILFAAGHNELRNQFSFYQVVTAGGLCGSTDFIFDCHRSFQAKALEGGTRVFKLSRHDYDKMKKEEPDVAEAVTNALLKSTILRLRNNLDNIR